MDWSEIFDPSTLLGEKTSNLMPTACGMMIKWRPHMTCGAFEHLIRVTGPGEARERPPSAVMMLL